VYIIRGKKIKFYFAFVGHIATTPKSHNFFLGYGISREKNTLKKKSLKKEQKNHTKIP